MVLEKIKIKPGSIIIMKINQSTATTTITNSPNNNLFNDIADKVITGLEDELKSKVIIDNGSIESVTILEAETL